MKLEIKQKLPEMNVLSTYGAGPLPEREAYIDGKRCPPGLEDIILAGMDVLVAKYIDGVLDFHEGEAE